MRKIITLLFMLSTLMFLGCSKSGQQGGKKKLTIAVIPKGTTHEFWKSIQAGSIKAARELSAQGQQVEVIWKGPLREDDREQQIQVVDGFISELKTKYPNIELVSSDQYAGATRDTAKRASENLLNRFGDDVQGIFTPNESSTAGMLLALQDINKAGKITFVGFDASDAFIEAMRKNQLQGIVLQNPLNMGYLGVRTMVESLQGKSVEKRIDTGVTIVTPDNLNAPEVQALLHPPLDQYLK